MGSKLKRGFPYLPANDSFPVQLYNRRETEAKPKNQSNKHINKATAEVKAEGSQLNKKAQVENKNGKNIIPIENPTASTNSGGTLPQVVSLQCIKRFTSIISSVDCDRGGWRGSRHLCLQDHC